MTRLARRAVLAGSAAAAGGLLLPRGGRAQAETPTRGGELRISTLYNPSTLDPITGRNASDVMFLFGIYDGLLEADPYTLELRPGLAKAWRFADATTLVLDLEEAVAFHDGTPFDAAAVKYNLLRARDDKRSNVRNDLKAVDSIDTPTPHRVVLRLSRPSAGLPGMLTDRAGLMASPTALAAGGGAIDRAPVGTGAFKFKSWQDAERLVVVRNQTYWRSGLPYLDSLNFQVINQTATGLRTVIADENDIAVNLTLAEKPVADKAGNVAVMLGKTIQFYGIYLNWGKPPLDDVRIRQALNWGVDRDEFERVIGLGLGETGSAILPREHWACDPATADYYRHDPAKAKALLAEAGHPDGVEIEMYSWSDQDSLRRAELLSGQLEQSNIHIKLTPTTPVDSGYFTQGKLSGRMAVVGARVDPVQAYSELFEKDAYYNPGHADTPGLVEAIEATEAALDQASRKAAFARLQRLVVEQALIVPVIYTTGIVVAQPRVRNFKIDVLLKAKFREVWKTA